MQGRFGRGCDAFIATGQVTEVEHDRGDTSCDSRWKQPGHLCMISLDERDLFRGPVHLQSCTCLVDRLLLQIESIDMPCFADKLRKEEGVVPVAHGCIDDNITGMHMPGDHLVSKFSQSSCHNAGYPLPGREVRR
jgi:hypothetical protein